MTEQEHAIHAERQDVLHTLSIVRDKLRKVKTEMVELEFELDSHLINLRRDVRLR